MISVFWVKQYPEGGVGHMFLRTSSPIKVTGLATPRRSYAKAKFFSTSLFVASFQSPKKVTAKVSSTFSQGSPSSFASFGFTSSCSLAYVWLSSVNYLSASSSGTLEFHVRKSKPTPLKTRIAALSTHAIDQPYLAQRWCHHDFLHMLWVFSS